MYLLLDIGNTVTNAALAGKRINHTISLPSSEWSNVTITAKLTRFIGRNRIHQAMVCSVIPAATKAACAWLKSKKVKTTTFNHNNCGLGIDYPKPETIGPDRLANSLSASSEFGSPVVVVDFGTAVTFDIVNQCGDYAGGVIAPGLSAMTDYLHEKTALLPKIQLRDINSAIGKSTEEAMRIGAVSGYRGLIQSLIEAIRGELNAESLPVVATGGHAKLLAKGVSQITAVRPLLTLEGLRLASGSSS